MPNVNGMKFPYTPAGKAAAKKAEEKDPKGPRPAKRMTAEDAKKRALKIKQEGYANALKRLGKGRNV